MQSATAASADLISEHRNALLVYEIKDSTGRESVNSFSRYSDWSTSQDHRENWVSIPGFQTGCRAHPASYSVGAVGFRSGVKRPGRETHRS
jgi:hypothetical protein